MNADQETTFEQGHIFPPWLDNFVKLAGAGAAFGGLYVAILVYFGFSAKALNVGYMPVQPVPYSHELHAGELGMDCRYCHTGVETAAHASVPPTATCMNCHQMVGKDSLPLAPVRRSYQSGLPVNWVRVHDLPDYVYFNHSAHVTRGVGCVDCHGRVDRMLEVRQVSPLSMSWCLDCHRDPARVLRPRDIASTNMEWGANLSASERREIGTQRMIDNGLLDEQGEQTPRFEVMTSCSTCHR